MDFNKLTLKSGEAVAGAQELARRMGNPELTPDHLTIALLDQELPRTLVERAGANADSIRAEAESRLRQQPTISGGNAAAARVRRVQPRDRQGAGRDALTRRRVRLRRAPRCSRSISFGRDAAARRARRGARRPARHVAGSRGLVPGTREVRARSHRARRERQARPRHRSGRGDPAHDPGALAPHEEQPGADRRARRRQDRDRRRARAADRRGRRPRRAARASASGRSTSARCSPARSTAASSRSG